MAHAENVQRVRIYLSRDDQWEGSPLYLALLEELRRAGATGATALQGLAGFGPGHRVRPALGDRVEQRQPVVIEWVDRAERVGRLLPLLDDLIGDALVTIEEIPVYRAILRARGPFGGDRSVGDLMRSPAPVIAADAPLTAAVALFVDEGLGALPVVDGADRLVGLITTEDLAWRAGLRLRPTLLAHLSPAEREAALSPLAGRAAREVMSAEPRSVSSSTAIPQALVTMVEWGYPQIPVIDRDGRVFGLLGQEQVLREVAAQAVASPEGSVRDAEPPPAVRLVMQTATARVVVSQRLSLALAQLLATPGHHLLVVDAANRLVGALTASSTLRGLAPDERQIFLAALQQERPPPAAALPGNDRGLAGVVEQSLPTIGPEASVLDAARVLTGADAELLAVVDDERQLLGIIARGGLIRALMQQSE